MIREPKSVESGYVGAQVVTGLERLELCHRLTGGVLIERGAVTPVLHEQHAVFLGERLVVVILYAALFREDGGAQAVSLHLFCKVPGLFAAIENVK